MPFTLSVRSFQVPDTPFTRAWPPSLPSVPTSRATRVTSEENAPSWLTMVLIVLPARRNSPRSGLPSSSRRTACVRSPLATASMTRVISRVDVMRLVTRKLMFSTCSDQPPSMRPRSMRWLILPSLPTSRVTRSISWVNCCFRSTPSLNVVAILPLMPVHSRGRRAEKSPCLTAVRAWRRRPESSWPSGSEGGVCLVAMGVYTFD